MTDSLYDDVVALLDKDFGEDRILKQILRACENDEVISNYERNYVRQLAEKHLGKKPIVQTPTPTQEKPIIPDVEIPKVQPMQTQTYQTQPKIKYSSNKKNSKLMLGIGGIALVIIIAIAVSFSGTEFTTPKVTTSTSNLDKFSVQTDLPSYSKSDLISISGVSDTSGTVNLTIENNKNELVWSEQVSIKSGGKFSTLAIAGGPGWESSGTYTLKVDNGKETTSDTFTFTS